MKIHLLDDVHLEFGKMPRDYAPPECDVVVLAGDIGVGRSGMAWAMATFPEDLPVVMVNGNHEYYGRSFDLIDELREKASKTPNIKFLENDRFDLGKYRFIGATMWTDFNLYEDAPIYARIASQGMNDFRQIEGMTTDVWLEKNAESTAYIATEVARAVEEGLTPIVVTHHAPDEGSIHPMYQMGAQAALNPAYASHTLKNMPVRPALWMHGHVHHRFDYMVDQTRVVTNPRGYVGYENIRGFDPGLVIEVE